MENNIIFEKQRIAKALSEQIVSTETDIIGIMLVGSVATEKARSDSDIDLYVITQERNEYKSLVYKGVEVDVSYVPIKYVHYTSRDYIGFIYDSSVIIYDPKGELRKLKDNLSQYPDNNRKSDFNSHFNYSCSYLEQANALLGNDELERASTYLYLAALYAWYSLFPINKRFRQGWIPLADETELLVKKPSQLEEKLNKILGYPKDKPELFERVKILKEFAIWAEIEGIKQFGEDVLGGKKK